MELPNYNIKEQIKLDSMIKYLSRNLGVEYNKVRDVFTDYPIFNPFAEYLKGNYHSFDIEMINKARQIVDHTILRNSNDYIKAFVLELSINQATGINRNNIIFAYNAILIQTPSYKEIFNDALYYGIIGNTSRKQSYYDLILSGRLIQFNHGEISRVELVNKNIFDKVCRIINDKENEHFNSFWNPSEINLTTLFAENIKDECHCPI